MALDLPMATLMASSLTAVVTAMVDAFAGAQASLTLPDPLSAWTSDPGHKMTGKAPLFAVEPVATALECRRAAAEQEGKTPEAALVLLHVKAEAGSRRTHRPSLGLESVRSPQCLGSLCADSTSAWRLEEEHQ
jgi:hypothetical protein